MYILLIYVCIYCMYAVLGVHLLAETVTMSISIAQLRHVFGLQREVTGNVAYYDEQTIVYPSGTNCVLYNIDQKQQKFILGSEKSRTMTAMAMSQNRRYVAIAERGDKEKGELNKLFLHYVCDSATGCCVYVASFPE